MIWPFRRRKADSSTRGSVTVDTEVARLTAQADLIMEELDAVVAQMSDMLRNAPGTTP